MKLITAVIRPGKLHEAMRAATDAGARGLTATKASGFGRQFGHLVKVSGREPHGALVPKVRLELLVQDENADDVVGAIVKTISTGKIGDGKIWVTTVEGVVRARTGERDREAI
jgi:nitrogen regulatory protein P-II 1